MQYDELKNHGFVTLDDEARVMRFTNYPVMTGPLPGKKRVSVELLFHKPDGSKPDEVVADDNMDAALCAAVKYIERGYAVDCMRGEFIDGTDYIEDAAFAYVWKYIDASLSERDLSELKGQLRADCDEIGGDYDAGYPSIDEDQMPFGWYPRHPVPEMPTGNIG
jgi:hypothetical protein